MIRKTEKLQNDHTDIYSNTRLDKEHFHTEELQDNKVPIPATRQAPDQYDFQRNFKG